MVHNIICGPWERTKGPWLCLMTHYHYLVSFDYFPLFSHVLTSLIKLILWLKFSRQNAGRGLGRTRTILSCSVSIWDRADVIIIEIKCPINVMHLNYPETIPRHPPHPSPDHRRVCGKTLPQNWFLLPKMLETADLNHLFNVFLIQDTCAPPWGCISVSLKQTVSLCFLPHIVLCL